MDEAPPEGGTQIFILGIIGLVVCQLAAPFAMMQGNQYVRMCKVTGAKPEGMAVAGRIMGMIGTALLVLQIALICLGMCAYGALGSMGNM